MILGGRFRPFFGPNKSFKRLERARFVLARGLQLTVKCQAHDFCNARAQVLQKGPYQNQAPAQGNALKKSMNHREGF